MNKIDINTDFNTKHIHTDKKNNNNNLKTNYN